VVIAPPIRTIARPVVVRPPGREANVVAPTVSSVRNETNAATKSQRHLRRLPVLSSHHRTKKSIAVSAGTRTSMIPTTLIPGNTDADPSSALTRSTVRALVNSARTSQTHTILAESIHGPVAVAVVQLSREDRRRLGA
jgi:hypothetical protein